MLPDQTIYSVREFYRSAVPSFAAGNPGILGPFKFIFPRSVEVAGILVLPALGTPEALASLSLGILDQDDEQIFTDGRGGVAAGQVAPFSQPLMALAGRALKPWPLLRTVRAHDRWILTLKNFSALAPVNVASVAIFFRKLDGTPL